MRAEKILVRGVNWLGDAVISTPALRRLREARPHASITLLTHSKLATLWQHLPWIDEVLTLRSRESVWSVGGRLKSKRFDIALLFPNSPRSALEVWLAGIPRRIGNARPWRNMFLTERLKARPHALVMHKRSDREVHHLVREESVYSETTPSTAHHLYHYLYLAAALGANPEPAAPRLVVLDEEVSKARHQFGIAEDPGRKRPWFGLNPGAEYGPAKRWPRENFIEAAVEIHRRTNCRWVIFGGDNDIELAANISAEIRHAAYKLHGDSMLANRLVVNLAGVTNLRELCATLKTCAVLLTNDTGPMHVAAAVGVPVVALFGSTSPVLTGPGLPGESRHVILNANVPCSPCFRRQCPIDFRCMHKITMNDAVEGVLRALRS